ncbi:hypothetical protein NL533_36125, partial [Klebsiella pneumoniae]|nr:hypothetical protein [Klebsiella pneumoniae]
MGGPMDPSGNAKAGSAGLPLANANAGIGGGCAAVCSPCLSGTIGATGMQGSAGVVGSGPGTLTATGVDGIA